MVDKTDIGKRQICVTPKIYEGTEFEVFIDGKKVYSDDYFLFRHTVGSGFHGALNVKIHVKKGKILIKEYDAFGIYVALHDEVLGRMEFLQQQFVDWLHTDKYDEWSVPNIYDREDNNIGKDKTVKDEDYNIDKSVDSNDIKIAPMEPVERVFDTNPKSVQPRVDRNELDKLVGNGLMRDAILIEEGQTFEYHHLVPLGPKLVVLYFSDHWNMDLFKDKKYLNRLFNHNFLHYKPIMVAKPSIEILDREKLKKVLTRSIKNKEGNKK